MGDGYQCRDFRRPVLSAEAITADLSREPFPALMNLRGRFPWVAPNVRKTTARLMDLIPAGSRFIGVGIRGRKILRPPQILLE